MDRATVLESAELEKFVASLSDFRPALPDELIRALLSRTGFQTDDVRVERYIALAAQKLLADISNDAIAQSRLRQNAAPSNRKSAAAAKEGKITLTIDDLERALREYGIALRKPPYFADSVGAGAPEVPVVLPGKPAQAGLSPSKQAKP